jgi:hypothetical protein
MIDKNKMIGIASNRLYCLLLIFIISCGQPRTSNEITDSNKSNTINHDSIISVVFRYGKTYLDIQSMDGIITLTGKPRYTYKTQWGVSEDSLTTFKYPYLSLNFFERPNSKIDLESISVFDKNIAIVGNLSIGKMTRKDILQNLGLPDMDHNDPGRSITKSGDTTVYGTQSGAGDTVTFLYNINIDEYAISFSMTKDTLRKVRWSKNMN